MDKSLIFADYFQVFRLFQKTEKQKIENFSSQN